MKPNHPVFDRCYVCGVQDSNSWSFPMGRHKHTERCEKDCDDKQTEYDALSCLCSDCEINRQISEERFSKTRAIPKQSVERSAKS